VDLAASGRLLSQCFALQAGSSECHAMNDSEFVLQSLATKSDAEILAELSMRVSSPVALRPALDQADVMEP
jgi:hypothetical protein